MRRTAQTLALAGALIAGGVAALPAAASQVRGGTTAGQPGAGLSPTRAQLRALSREQRLAALRSPRGVITGVVRGPGGGPEAGVCVVASGLLATRRTFTRPDGRFVLGGLPRGGYRVEYRGCSPIGRFTAQWYGGLTRESAAKVVVASSAPVELAPVTLGMISPRFTRPAPPASRARHLSAGQRLNALAMRLASGRTFQAPASGTNVGYISGRVTSRAGHPVAHVCVEVVPTGGRYFAGFGTSSSSGRYRLRVRPGRYYVVFAPFCARKANYAPQLWKAAESTGKATVLRVAAHQRVTGIDAALRVGAVITGRLRTRAKRHPPIGRLCVGADGTGPQRLFFGFRLTRRDGTFRLPSLATGRYRLVVNPCGTNSPWLSPASRRLIAVTDGKTTSGVTVVLTLGGSITGTVKSSSGARLAGICVVAITTSHYYQATTSADGTYRLRGLVAGGYRMDFAPGCGNKGPYAAVQLASQVAVRLGQTTPHVDAVLPVDGTVTGVVRNEASKPLGGICVFAQAGQNFAFARTAADGTYTLKKVAPGDYQLQFIPGGVFSNCGNHGNYLPATAAVTVTSQVTSTADAVLPTGGVISGVVTDSRGRPAAGVCVGSNAGFGAFTVTASDGSYRLRQLFAGSYNVSFQGGCGNSESLAPVAYRGDRTFDSPTSVSVSEGQITSGIGARMPPGATITGRIADRAGKPVSLVCVAVSGVTGAGGGGLFADFEIDRNGLYTATNLPPGQYEVTFAGQLSRHHGCRSARYADQEFNARGIGATPDLVYAAGGKVTSGVDARLALAGQITGLVTAKAGTPLRGICVTATSPRTGAGTQGFTNSHGTYTLTGLPSGRYSVEFSACNSFLFFGQSGPNYANQWYKGRITSRSADAVVVRAQQTTPNVDAAMTRGGQISGQVVYRPSHRPVGFVCVNAYTPDLSTVSVGFTDRRGRYTVNALSTGDYIVEFVPCSAESALAGQIRSGRLHVVAGQAVHAGVEQLQLGGSVAGVASVRLGRGSRPAPGTCVELLPLFRTASGFAAIALQGGQYRATGLAPGRYEILAGDPACSNDVPSVSARTSGPVVVAAGQTTAGNVALPTAGGIAGAVRGLAGKPVAGICVAAVPLRGGLGIPAGITAGGGAFRIGDLQPGRYLVSFTAGCGANGYSGRWYKNAPTRSDATVVVVRPAQVTTGVNVTLVRQ